MRLYDCAQHTETYCMDSGTLTVRVRLIFSTAPFEESYCDLFCTLKTGLDDQMKQIQYAQVQYSS